MESTRVHFRQTVSWFFCVVTLCGLYVEDGYVVSPRIVGIYVQVHTVLQFTRPSPTYFIQMLIVALPAMTVLSDSHLSKVTQVMSQ